MAGDERDERSLLSYQPAAVMAFGWLAVDSPRGMLHIPIPSVHTVQQRSASTAHVAQPTYFVITLGCTT